MYSISYVCLPIHSWANTPDTPTAPSAEPSNSFVRLPQFFFRIPNRSHVFQFIRMSSNSFVFQPKTNSFVYRPIHSYVFLKNLSEPQFIRMSSTSFVRLPEKIFLNSKSFVCRPSLSYALPSYVFLKNLSELQFIRMSSKSFVCLLIHSYVFQKQILHPNSFVCLPLP